jgi:hypothetical protein
VNPTSQIFLEVSLSPALFLKQSAGTPSLQVGQQIKILVTIHGFRAIYD